MSTPEPTRPAPPARPRVTWASRIELIKALQREGETGWDLAKRLKTTPSHVYGLMRGRRPISEATATQLHEWYGVEVRLQRHLEPYTQPEDPQPPGAVSSSVS